MKEFQPIIDSLQAHARQDQIDLNLLEQAIGLLKRSENKFLPEYPVDYTNQRKQITILFADIVGFTKWSETQDAELLHRLIDRLFISLDEAILAEGGMIDKHMGDAVMALFGVGKSRENEPLHAVKAAWKMQKVLKTTLKQMPEEFGIAEPPPLKLRIGLHTGPVLLGVIGVNQEFTAMGDTVNLASRLESNAPPGEILVSGTIFHHIVDYFVLVAIPPLTVKGKSQPVVAYRVNRAKRRQLRRVPHEFEGIEIPMIGREGELNILKDMFQYVIQHRQCQMGTLIGEPGIGKSRLIEAFHLTIAEISKKVQMFESYLESRSSTHPNAVLRDWLSLYFQIRESDSMTQAQQKLEEGLLSYLGKDAASAIPVLGYLMGLDYSTHPDVKGLLNTPKQLRIQAFQALLFLFTALARDADVIYLLAEDIHWMDEGSLELLRFLLQQAPQLPLMIVATARPQLLAGQPHWEEDNNHHKVHVLEALNLAQSQALLAAFFQQSSFSESFARQMIERSGGNPYYLEELSKHFVEVDVLTKQNKNWKINETKLSQIILPSTLTGVIQSRIDRLPHSYRRVIAHASVVGQTFWGSTLEAIITENPFQSADPELEAILEGLKNHGLITVEVNSAFEFTKEYQFRHSVVEEVVYENILHSHRQELHGKVALWLVENIGERAEEYAAQIADHFDKAGNREKSLFWWIKAARYALGQHLLRQALKNFRHCLELLPPDDQTQRLLILAYLGNIYYDLAEWQWCESTWQAILEIDHPPQKEGPIAKAYLGLSLLYSQTGKNQSALELAIKAVEVEKTFEGISETLVEATMMKGWAYFRLEQFDKAKVYLEESLSLGQKIQADFLIGQCLNRLANTLLYLNQPDQCIVARKQALTIFKKLNHLEQQAVVINTLGETYKWIGEYPEAFRCYQEAILLFQKAGSRRGELITQNNYAGALVHHRKHKKAQELLNPLMELPDMQEGFWFEEGCAFYADACIGVGEWERAWKWAKRGLDGASQRNRKEHIAISWRLLGKLVSLQNQPFHYENQQFSAEQCFQRSWDDCQSLGIKFEQAFTLKAWAEHLFRAGQSGTAQPKWEQAKALFQEVGNYTEAKWMEEEEQARVIT